MSSSRDKLLQQFRELVVERLERVSRALVKLENGPDLEAGKAVLRELHGLKGEARMMGFAEVNALVHEMEELVRAAQPKEYALGAGSIDALLVVSDAVTALSQVAPGAPSTVEVPRLIEWLKQRIDAEKGVAPKAAAAVPVVADIAAPPAPAPSAPAPPPSAPAPSIPGAAPSSPEAKPRGSADGGVRLSQQSLETLTSSAASLLQRNRRRELSSLRQLQLTRELQQLHRMAEDLGPVGAALAGRLGRAKEAAAELHRDHKLLANEELRDLTQLSEEVQAMRMVPLTLLFEPYPRMVRELARELGKEVELLVEGEDTRVDRSVLDALKDPLLHLVRNSLDHGLEPKEHRLELGKAARGRLMLKAQREGERLVLSVEDDGRGLDVGQLRSAAVRKGVIDEASASRLTDAQVRELIFVSGFSSKDVATDLSGRGVGLDVVRHKLTALGGEVSVESTPGKRTVFELKVPVSLTVLPLLFIKVGDERLCLTAANVDHALKVEQPQLRELAGRPALSVGDALLPFASISSILGATPQRAASEGELVLVVKGRGQTAAIAVDQVLEERVQPVLPLKGVLARYQHLNGATPLADGSLAMVLSAAHLVATAQGQGAPLRAASKTEALKKRRRILVVDDSPLTRELLCSMLEAVGYEIVSANDGGDAMERLSKETVDMVVTDLEMPKVDGLELTRRLKSHPTFSALPVVIVTTRGSEADRRRGMEAGADGYVTKSDLVRQDLVDVVARLLA